MPTPRTLLVVHHSHTDIGYTERQDRIERWHVDFLREALRISDDRPGFKWTCETFWAVERFLEVGPGSVLSGLIRRTVKGQRPISVAEPTALEKL